MAATVVIETPDQHAAWMAQQSPTALAAVSGQ
jgi:hypothetical protein